VTRPELRIVVAADRYRGSDPMRRVAGQRRDDDAPGCRIAERGCCRGFDRSLLAEPLLETERR